MIERHNGDDISVASMLSLRGGVDRVAYAAARHAVATLTRALASERGLHHVQGNALTPQFPKAEMARPLIRRAEPHTWIPPR